jgi:hypothetical protein
MSYEIFYKKNKTLPQEKAKSRKSEDISEKLAAIYSKIPENEQTAYCGATLDFWRELTKNDSWSISHKNVKQNVK